MVKVYCICGGDLKHNKADGCFDCLKCPRKFKLKVELIPIVRDKKQPSIEAVFLDMPCDGTDKEGPIDGNFKEYAK